MKRLMKVSLWVVGLALLITIIWLPDSENEPAWTTWSLPLSGKTIVIDPGHGGPDGGARASDKTEEKDIALIVAKRLQKYLQQSGAIVYLTRETDTDLAAEDTKGLSRRKAEDIRKRLTFIQEKQTDFFVTVHLNALQATQWHGAQTFYYPKSDKSKHLAKMIQAEMTRQLDNTNRTALALEHIYLLKHAEIPGALLEIGFLSNEEERDLLKTEDYQEKVAGSIYNGILRYVTEDPPKEE